MGKPAEHELQRRDSCSGRRRNILWWVATWSERSCEKLEKIVTLTESSVVNLWRTSPHDVDVKKLMDV